MFQTIFIFLFIWLAFSSEHLKNSLKIFANVHCGENRSVILISDINSESADINHT